MANPSRHHLTHPLTLPQLKKLKEWHIAQHGTHPVEYEVWNAVLTVWLMGWIGCLPALAFDAARAQERGRLRCDWLALVSNA
jgi:hypothetical protein